MGGDWVLMDGAMTSKSLIQFSIDEWSYVPSLIFIWGQTIVEVMKIMVTSFKRSQAYNATLSAPTPAAGHACAQRCWGIHGQVQDSLLWGHCSFLLGPGAQGSVVPSKNLFPSPV